MRVMNRMERRAFERAEHREFQKAVAAERFRNPELYWRLMMADAGMGNGLPAMAGGATTATQQNPTKQTNQGAVRFRAATYERTQGPQTSLSVTMTTSAQPQLVTVKGTGYMSRLRIRVRADATGNASSNSVAYVEDAPWTAIANLQLQDSNGQLVNITGFELFLANLMDAKYRNRYLDQANSFVQSSGTGSTAGSFEFWIDVPIILNERDLRGLLGNQDRATEYQLSFTLGASTTVYSTSPSALPTYKVDIYYESYAVPFARNAAGAAQEQLPPTYGLLHYTQSMVSDVVPAPGTLQHYLKQGLGNDIRWLGLVFRQGTTGGTNTPRANANADLTSVNSTANNTAIQVQFGDVTQFNEDFDYRRSKMYERYGFDLPTGVLVYDAIHDFQAGAGNEAGADYWHTANLGTSAYVQVAYQSAFTSSSSNSLTMITDSILYRPPVTQPIVS